MAVVPNAFAYLALAAWPVVAFLLFRALPRPAALIWTVVGGYLLLPTGAGVDLPMIPTLDKTLIPALCAAILSLMSRDLPAARRTVSAPAAATAAASASPSWGSRRQASVTAEANMATPRSPIGLLEWLLLAGMVLGPLVTAMQNAEPFVSGVRWIQGLTPYDGVSAMLAGLIYILPYLLARRYLGGEKQHVTLLTILCLAALAYSLLALVEVRMSPQLSRWVYGFLFADFIHSMRDGGFRPVAFLQGGLWLVLFLAMGLLAAAVLSRVQLQRRTKWLAAAGWLLVTIVLCRSLGALVIAIALLPVAALMRVRAQLIVAAVVAATIVAYPALRGAGVIPVDTIMALAESISADRAGSFNVRLVNEDALLAHANEKPLAGWGGWGRSRIYDPDSGKDISITDGSWIIAIGTSGWLGYVAQFGLLTLPIFILAVRRRRREIPLATGGLCLVLAANLIDLIPNATLTPVTWLVAGAIMSRASLRAPEPAKPEMPPRRAASFARAENYRPTRRKAPATLR